MNMSVMRRRAVMSAVGVATIGLLAGGCASDSSDPEDVEPTADASMSSDMDDMSGMMNDPSATPASELSGAVESSFGLLDTRPPGTDEVEGTAWLAQGDQGTTLTVTMTGLEPGAEYIGHLHAQGCADDNGGPHFKFDLDGSSTPPNEVHIGFTADDNGAGSATVTNERAVGDAARAVVIHPAEALDNRLACADF